ncbi:MAG: YitT family protein [Chloroflexota bacterium]
MIDVNFRVLAVQYFWMTVAVMISAVAVIVFLAPFDIAPSGISGLAVIFNDLIGTPIGLMTFVLNIPIQIMAYYMLPGSWRVVVRTVYLLVIYSFALDLLDAYIPDTGVSENVLLNAMFGGVLEGVAGGLSYRAGGTFGGTSTLALIIRRRIGTSMSTTLLYTDLLVIGAAGLTFGWEAALYAAVSIFISGLASDYVMEGPAVVRTAMIVTNYPREVSQAIMMRLDRGVTGWEVTGMYTGQRRWLLWVSASRSQINELTRVVRAIDPRAFVVVGHGHNAYGEGFVQRERLVSELI